VSIPSHLGKRSKERKEREEKDRRANRTKANTSLLPLTGKQLCIAAYKGLFYLTY